MNSKFCRALQPDEPLNRGDLGSLFWRGQGNYHSFVRLDNDTVFAKGSPESTYPYQVGAYEDMFNEGFKALAKVCKGTEGELSRNSCGFEVVHHRCHAPPDDFYSKYPELANLDSKVQQIEKFMTNWMTNGSAALQPEFDRRLREMGAYLKELRAKRYTGEKEFARKAMEWRLVGFLMTDYDRIQGLSEDALAATETAFQIQARERDHVPDSPRDVVRKVK